MIALKENYIVDKDGERVGVLLDMKNYRKLLDRKNRCTAPICV